MEIVGVVVITSAQVLGDQRPSAHPPSLSHLCGREGGDIPTCLQVGQCQVVVWFFNIITILADCFTTIQRIVRALVIVTFQSNMHVATMLVLYWRERVSTWSANF